MSINELIKKGILIEQATSRREIEDLLKIVERDFADSDSSDISADWRFGIAYNAALKLATVLIRASGFRIKGQGHHMNVIATIPYILGNDKQDDSDYLDTCRRKRNIVEYDYIGGVMEADVDELREFVMNFKMEVISWLQENHHQLL